ncbi:GNAT family N-acetyltransferase [Kitasatospora aureofaciens]|uniref:GNAT family N-acetyltransferase n=1 Tax=Kitasatospora aureofaciens TaxID=1894 RepID=UPI001C48F54E|nr:GNAT family N-acetyltransferase [Kitasatospora aureofaciens]MBV6700462.1 GNAT family N-acetyltransferase [Kitasatospora aureofaciens]
MLITACEPAHVALLEEHLPSGGRSSFHARRFTRQLAGTSTYLVAWVDDRPVGNAELRWNGCAAAEVRRSLPDCPEINGLDVAEPLRGRGIGTALIRHAERLAVRRGVRRIGLGVDEEGNPRAAALYARLGYRPVVRYIDRWSYVDDRGEVHDVEDPCVFLAKELAAEG